MSRPRGQAIQPMPAGAVDSEESAHHAIDQLRRGRPFVALAVVFIIGTALGALWPAGWWWLFIALGPISVMGVMLWRSRHGDAGAVRASLCWGLVAVLPLGGAWSTLRTTHVSAHTIMRHLADESRLAEVTGIVVDEPYLRTPKRGDFGQFSYMPPATVFRLSLDSIMHQGERVPVTGTVLGRIDAADHRLRSGQRIIARGWLAPIEAPSNPGEFDHQRRLAEQGVYARLTLRNRGNWSLHDTAPGARPWHQRIVTWRGTLAREAREVLRLGMLDGPDKAMQDEQRRRLALLEALLLGQWSEETVLIHDSFRRVGLAHLMAISGAHLGILMGLVWLIVRLIAPHPGRASTIVLIVLGVYLMIVPLRVPIVRAALMAAFLCAGYGRGRDVSAMGMLSLAAVTVLLWRPADLFSPGFQLSFGIVAALLLFTRPLAAWMWPADEHASTAHEPMSWWLARRAVEYVAVSLIAFGVALPVVAYHFEMVNPLAVLMSILALPVVTALLGLGYLKMLVGALLPSASMLLAGPLAWVTDTMLNLVEHAETWPAATIELTRPPPVAWVMAMLVVVTAALWGCFAQRRAALATCAVVLLSWAFAVQRPDTVEPIIHFVQRNDTAAATLRVNMFAVGHGSAHLIRLGDHTFMYDCGSQPYLDVGERRILPALRRLGVRRIDTLFISHAHLDHYSGVLALVDAMTVGEVRGPPQFFDVARENPTGSAAFLVEQLEQRNLPIIPTVRGWSRELEHGRIDAIWPPQDYDPPRANDTSLVLLIQSGDRRLMMTGDMEQEAIDGLIARGDDTRADVAELPHHGGWVDSSPDWLDAVSPRVVLQSSTRPGGRRDPWTELLAERGVDRLATHELGMIEVVMPPGEPIRWRAFRDAAGPWREVEEVREAEAVGLR